VFFGYDLTSKRYWCFCLEKNNTIFKDVIFDENHPRFSLATMVKTIPATIETCAGAFQNLKTLHQ
jgi:hypothetical protein